MDVLHFNTLKNVELRNRFSWLGFAIEFALGLHWFFSNYLEKPCLTIVLIAEIVITRMS